MAKIVITRIIVVSPDGRKRAHDVRVGLELSALEEHRKDIKDNCCADHILFNYEEVEDD
jgi:hypothetical protein